jgi:hypothetical protein
LDNTGFKTETRGSLPKLELDNTGSELHQSRFSSKARTQPHWFGTWNPRFSSKAKTRQAHYWINETQTKTFSSKPEEN